MQDILKEYWNSILLKYTDRLYSDELFRNLINQYSDKSRYYHNSTHIQKMLDFSLAFSDKIMEPEVVQLAIYYHDVIYNSLSKNNETDSASLAVQQLSKTTFSAEKIKLTEQFILSTQKHLPLTEHPDVYYFLDFDLAILGTSEDIYQDYAEKIQKEYKWVPSFLYTKNRTKVLEHFLSRKEIYFTEIFRNEYESVARKNMQYEIDVLLK